MTTLRLRAFFEGLAIFASALLVIPQRLSAEDVYVVRFLTPLLSRSETQCLVLGWWDHLVFRNTTDRDLPVRLLSASNGYVPPRDDVLNVQAGQTHSLFVLGNRSAGRPFNAWTPPPTSFVFLVNRLDVPSGILVESRTEVYGTESFTSCPGREVVLGSVPLPVVRSLTPANSTQFHLASDLGTQRSRTNVGIYNGGTADATASIEIRRSCDDALVESRAVAIPANTVIQAEGFINDVQASFCIGSGHSPNHARYVIVRVDQPSFSFVTTIAMDLSPKIAVSATTAR